MSRQYSSDAGKWIAESNLSWGSKKSPPGGEKAKRSSTKRRRVLRGKNYGERVSRFESIKDFVQSNRNHDGSECLCVPAAQPDVPASVEFCGKQISAARYMALLNYGAPKSEGMVVRHLCGNGHLSCVNPAHLAWGTPGDNISDAIKHRALGDDATAQDRINSVTR